MTDRPEPPPAAVDPAAANRARVPGATRLIDQARAVFGDDLSDRYPVK